MASTVRLLPLHSTNLYCCEFRFQTQHYRGANGTSPRHKAIQFLRGISAQAPQHPVLRWKGYGAYLTVQDACSKYLSARMKRVDSKRVAEERQCLERMVAWIGADTLMSGISTETMRMVVAKRKGETKQTQKRVLQQTSAQVRALCASVNLSGKTINATTWRLFRRVYMMARNVWGVPLQQISWESLKVPETAPHFHEITVEEERQFAALRSFSTRYGPCFTFALKSGLGLQEIADLKWSQVDFERRAIWVSMRNGSIRRAAIDGAMMEILLNEFGKEPVHVFTLGEQGAGGKGNPNSSQGRRRPITIAGLRSWFARARTRLQLHVRARDLRYTGAMRLLSVTGNAGAARQFLGLTVPKREFAKLGRTCIPISEMIKLQDRVHSEIRRRSLSQDTSYRPTRGINFE